MCGPYFNEAATSSIQDYHIHIYFKPGMLMDLEATETEASLLAQELKRKFRSKAEGPYEVGIVGPHAAPNYEVNIPREAFGEIVAWLQINSHGLSILIHPETGDVRKDHLESAMWLGKPVPFNEAFFVKLGAKKPAGGKPPAM